MWGREENGNPELIPGINLIVPIPPHEYLELYSPELFDCPKTAFPCFRVSQRWVFELQGARPQTPPILGSGEPWTQVISDGPPSLHQQKSVGPNWVCLFSEIQEPQATGFNQDNSLCGNWGSSTKDLVPLRFRNAGKLVSTECLPLTWPSCKRRLSQRQTH